MVDFTKIKALIALSNAQASAAAKYYFKQKDSFARAAENKEEVQEHLKNFSFNLVLIDEDFSDLGGIEFSKFLRFTGGPISFARIILGINTAELPLVKGGRDAGVDKIILMPLTFKILEKSVLEVMQDKRNFITVDTYSGPDRRVKQGKPPSGEERRLAQEGVVPTPSLNKARGV